MNKDEMPLDTPLEQVLRQVRIALQVSRPEYGAFSPPPHIGRAATVTALLNSLEKLETLPQ